MKILLVYYSHTGNNAVLAQEVAERIGAETFRIQERKSRTEKMIVLDMILHRNPKLQSVPDKVESYDLVLFMGPVWMFSINSPLKSCMKAIRKQVRRYGFVSLSGGALGPNTGLSKQLKRIAGRNQALQLDLPAKYFCSIQEGAGVNDTSSYLLQEHPEDLNNISALVTAAVSALSV